MNASPLAEHFADLETQQRAARLGMWVFLASEILLFAGLFTIWAAYDVTYGPGFRAAARHNTLTLGTINTAVLLTSSLTAALSLWALETERRLLSTGLALLTALAGLAFLAIKGVEYQKHIAEGLLPGAAFNSHVLSGPGPRLFYGLYWFMTGLHAIHVLVAVGVMLWAARAVRRRHITGQHSIALENATLYWHLVDIIWLFLWPLLYLLR